MPTKRELTNNKKNKKKKKMKTLKGHKKQTESAVTQQVQRVPQRRHQHRGKRRRRSQRQNIARLKQSNHQLAQTNQNLSRLVRQIHENQCHLIETMRRDHVLVSQEQNLLNQILLQMGRPRNTCLMFGDVDEIYQLFVHGKERLRQAGLRMTKTSTHQFQVVAIHNSRERIHIQCSKNEYSRRNLRAAGVKVPRVCVYGRNCVAFEQRGWCNFAHADSAYASKLYNPSQ